MEQAVAVTGAALCSVHAPALLMHCLPPGQLQRSTAATLRARRTRINSVCHRNVVYALPLVPSGPVSLAHMLYAGWGRKWRRNHTPLMPSYCYV
jgi:hypothetical protein